MYLRIPFSSSDSIAINYGNLEANVSFYCAFDVDFDLNEIKINPGWRAYIDEFGNIKIVTDYEYSRLFPPSVEYIKDIK